MTHKHTTVRTLWEAIAQAARMSDCCFAIEIRRLSSGRLDWCFIYADCVLA